MNNEKLESAWAHLCEVIRKYDDIDATQIDAFFSRLQPQAMSDGFLMLTADNDFIKTWIERHYRQVIMQALEDVYGVSYLVEIEVDSSQGNTTAKQEARGAEEPSKGEGEAPIKEVVPSHPQSDRENHEKEAGTQERSALEDGTAPMLTFENFVIGNSNRMAYHMAVSVAEVPGKRNLNPLFIYGRSGLGKTHLLRAIQNYIIETQPSLKTVYVDSAELLSDYMDASAAHDKEKLSYRTFKDKYEHADVLLIDDVQWLQGKKQTLDIVFQIFNKLIDDNKQIVLSADRAPKNIDIDERYASRFNSGGTFDIQPPELETKLGIIKSYIAEYRENEGLEDFAISEEIQMYIAESSGSNIRELKSAVTKVIYQINYFDKSDLSLDDVKKLLENHFTGGPLKKLTIADIQKATEEYFKVSHSEMVGKKRTRDIKYARQVAIYLCRQMLDLPYNDIGKKFGRDHSTIMYSVSIVEDKMKENREIREEVESIKMILNER